MTTYARIVDGCAIDVIAADPKTIFHPDVAAQFVTVPDGTATGDRKDGSKWIKYAEPEALPPAVVAVMVTPPQFKMLIMSELAEIIELSKTDVKISSFMEIVNDPRLTEVDMKLPSVQAAVNYCLKAIGRSDEQVAQRMPEILSGALT